MLQIGVTCPACNQPYTACVASDNYAQVSNMVAAHIPQCVDCFAKRIHAPPEVKAWIVSQLKAIPYEIIP